MKFIPTLLFVSLLNTAIAQNPVVVELFTSQGCSSCPAADKNLAEIIEQAEKNGQPVYGLSFHVDYWNHIGWKDPYSKVEFTTRQKNYATFLNPESIYTPQMIVNGEREFVGSDKKTSLEAINKSLATKMEYIISITEFKKDNEKVRVSYSLDKIPIDQTVVVALVEKDAGNEVTRGENSGKRLTHRNVVRSLASSEAKKEGTIQIQMPAKISQYQVIAFTQDRKWRVTSATHKNF